jgi:acyl-CoA reductase-like NAD-dependent aldehyde dehydrogenase
VDAAPRRVGKLGFTLRVPRGRGGAIAPFNFPLNLVVHKVAPAIAAGCPVVLKPASQTPLSAIRLAEMLIDECGLPAGHLNVVTGSGARWATPWWITPTWPGHVHRLARGRLGDRRAGAPQEGGLELGNNAPLIIEPTATGGTAAAKIAGGGLQPRRAVVHLHPAGLRAPVHRGRLRGGPDRRSSSLVVGDPLDEATDVSALISEARPRPGAGLGRRGGRRRGATWRREARSSTGCSAPPCSPRDADMEVCRSEVFGPVVAVAVRGARRRPALANDTRYGLQAAIFTADLDARP